MNDPNWPELLTGLMDRANDQLRNGDRQAAASDMARASELLFLQAKGASNLEEKQRFVKRAGQLLEASLTLSNTGQKQRVSLEQDDAVSVEPYRGDRLTFDDIAGLDAVKETLFQRIIYPLRYPEKLQKYRISAGGGMLLYGPPGTGKTLLARAVAGELGLPFYVIKSSEILSQFYGQSEKQLAELFKNARNTPKGAVIFLDEIDALGAKRHEQMNEATRRVLNQLLQELDGVSGKSEKLVFLAATNEPWLLDAALLRPPRFCEKCHIPLPDGPARKVLFVMSLKNCPMDPDVSLDELVQNSEQLSGADIVNVCERAKLIPFCESIRSGVERNIMMSDFEKAMENVRPSVTRNMICRFENWENQ